MLHLLVDSAGFRKWIWADNPRPYGSYGNGSAMRVSPVGWAFSSLEETLAAARQSAEVTHDHPEGIKGAQAVASAIYLARTGKSKPEIKEIILNRPSATTWIGIAMK